MRSSSHDSEMGEEAKFVAAPASDDLQTHPRLTEAEYTDGGQLNSEDQVGWDGCRLGESVSLLYLKDIATDRIDRMNLEADGGIEDFIGDICTRFLEIPPDEIDGEIANTLLSARRFTEAESVHLVLLKPEDPNRQRWYGSFDTAVNRSLRSAPDLLPTNWLKERIGSSDRLSVVREELPDEAHIEKKAWEMLGIHSILAIPIARTKKLIGFIALLGTRGNSQWEGTDVSALKLVGHILITVVGRKTDETDINVGVSEATAAGRALLETESKFRHLSEQSMAGVYLLQDDRFRFVNKQFAEVFGYDEDEIIEKKGPGDLVHGEDRPKVLENVERRISGEIDSVHYEFRGMKKNGQPVNIEVHGSRTTHEGRPAIIGTLLDISDRKRLETQLIQSEKMKAIGTLAGGIAHDFNNILMAIQGYTSLMLHLLEPTHAHHSKLKGIEDLVTSGSDLTKQLLAFASGGTFEIRPADLNEIVRKTSTMFARTRKEISIQTAYDGGAPVVDVDSGQIDQMLLNLYVNAWQAMPGGGTLILTTENVALDKKFVRPFGVRPGKFVKISVSDTGIGMDEKTRERIFEPFFTTKRRGRGTGLGLASVYNTVVGHGGIIQVESEPGSGTTFHIYLPLSKKAVEKTEEACQTLVKGRETVLLVDDEETVITVSRDMLEALGYSVLTAASGREACEVYRAHKAIVDLVILDVIMPDMGGEETFTELLNISPSVRVILSSGYSLDGLAAKIMERGCKAFIQKPFTINALSQKLREVLSSDN